MSRLPADDLQWALQRRLEDVFAKLGEKFGDLTGRVETEIHPDVSFDDVGGLQAAKDLLRGFTLALRSPESYARWGIPPPKGVLLYGPPGTGKSKLARALATAAGAIFYHVKLLNLTSKFGANTGELLQEILRIAGGEGRAVLLLDEAEALSLEHLLPPPAAREASARPVAGPACDSGQADEKVACAAVRGAGIGGPLLSVPPGRAERKPRVAAVVGAARASVGRPTGAAGLCSAGACALRRPLVATAQVRVR